MIYLPSFTWFTEPTSSRNNSTAAAPSNSLLSRIGTVVKTALTCVTLLILLWANTKISIGAFLIGVVLGKENMQVCNSRLAKKWEESKGVYCVALVVFAYMQLPMAIGAFTVFMYANAGAS